MNSDTPDVLRDEFVAAAESTAAILRAWVDGLAEAELRRLDQIMSLGVRPAVLIVPNGPDAPCTGRVVLVDVADGIVTAASIDFGGRRILN